MTFNWYWLVDGLQAAGFTVHLAHTTAIKKIGGQVDYIVRIPPALLF